MDFGRCKECLEYKYLVGEGKCREHVSWTPVKVGVETRYGATAPRVLSIVSDALVNDSRLVTETEEPELVFVVTTMELLIEDEDGDAVQTFEYGGEGEDTAQQAVETALDWVSTHYVN